ncbi:hypothetical protein TEU_03345 [Thermococcus eurythermalis]|uniref:Uncharacterized protein n=1 Tax=Thermococcus eurythermalis TaxID=1505907 RepID=A0A097QSJ7_9EURY|nr:hypothetical protein [Thermococcus eurythermalis]AIU69458.1 hypothetical protein TEU_03345 [Thermococcus eurythermalis]
MSILDRIFAHQETVVFVYRTGKVKVFKKARDETGAFIINNHKYYPIKDRSTHIFIEGYSNEISSIELIEGDKVKLIGSEDVELIVQSEVLRQIANAGSKWFEKLQNNQYIMIAITVFSLLAVIMLYYKLQNLEKMVQALWTAVQTLQQQLSTVQPQQPNINLP